MHRVHRGGEGRGGALRLSDGGSLPRPAMIVFSYGTLCEPLVRDRVLGHTVDVRPAILRGFSKVCGWDYLTLVPSDGTVSGVVFEADADDVARMDEWEDVPVYVPTEVSVEVDGSTVSAYAYIMPEPPAAHEVVEDSRIAAIPLDRIMADLESMMGGARGGRM